MVIEETGENEEVKPVLILLLKKGFQKEKLIPKTTKSANMKL